MIAAHSAMAGPPVGHLSCKERCEVLSEGGSSDRPSLAVQHPSGWASLGTVGCRLLWTKMKSGVEVNV